MNCIKCNVKLSENNWYKSCIAKKDYIYKTCIFKRNKEYKDRNPDYYKFYNKNYYLKNKEELVRYQREYRKNHPEKRKKSKHKTYLKYRQRILSEYKEYRESHKKSILKGIHIWLKTPKGRKYQKTQRNRRQRNLGFNPLNTYFDKSHAHHINNIDVIYIPIDLHMMFAGRHTTKHIDTMIAVNTVAFFFLMQQNIKEISKHFGWCR